VQTNRTASAEISFQTDFCDRCRILSDHPVGQSKWSIPATPDVYGFHALRRFIVPVLIDLKEPIKDLGCERVFKGGKSEDKKSSA
jgi:hypothetical protein